MVDNVIVTRAEGYSFVLVNRMSDGTNNFAGQPDVWRVDSYWHTDDVAQVRAHFLRKREEPHP